jgi:CBS domain-containing protein
MFIPEKLQEIAEQVKTGITPEATPRTLMSWFGFQRRTSGNAWVMNWALQHLRIVTDPDYQYAYVDSPIKFGPIKAETQNENNGTQPEHKDHSAPETSSQEAPLPASGGALVDPTYRIGKLPFANKEVIRVSPDAPLSEAITLMLAHQFSQLPVMTGAFQVKGLVSWKSIGTRMSLGKSCAFVRDCMDKHHEVSADSSLFQVIDLVVKHEAVVIKDGTRKVCGIMTTSDLSETFNQLAEPFLLLGQIENHIRRLIDGKFSKTELSKARDPSDVQREINSVHDLSFGEYIRLLENPKSWSKLDNHIDRLTFVRDLEAVRKIRNDAMHFDPEGIGDDALMTLRRFLFFLERLHEISNS